MRTVPVTVGRALAVNDCGEAIGDTTLKLCMRGKHTCVNDVRRHSAARCREDVLTIQRKSALINAIKTPCCIRLRRHNVGIDSNNSVWLNTNHVRVIAKT